MADFRLTKICHGRLSSDEDLPRQTFVRWKSVPELCARVAHESHSRRIPDTPPRCSRRTHSKELVPQTNPGPCAPPPPACPLPEVACRLLDDVTHRKPQPANGGGGGGVPADGAARGDGLIGNSAGEVDAMLQDGAPNDVVGLSLRAHNLRVLRHPLVHQHIERLWLGGLLEVLTSKSLGVPLRIRSFMTLAHDAVQSIEHAAAATMGSTRSTAQQAAHLECDREPMQRRGGRQTAPPHARGASRRVAPSFRFVSVRNPLRDMTTRRASLARRSRCVVCVRARAAAQLRPAPAVARTAARDALATLAIGEQLRERRERVARPPRRGRALRAVRARPRRLLGALRAARVLLLRAATGRERRGEPRVWGTSALECVRRERGGVSGIRRERDSGATLAHSSEGIISTSDLCVVCERLSSLSVGSWWSYFE